VTKEERVLTKWILEKNANGNYNWAIEISSDDACNGMRLVNYDKQGTGLPGGSDRIFWSHPAQIESTFACHFTFSLLPNDTLNADVFKMFGLNDGDTYENSIAT
jgi:hypothetical protein